MKIDICGIVEAWVFWQWRPSVEWYSRSVDWRISGLAFQLIEHV